ncbi:STAS domain-containing protein [Halochromatium sp.]
MAEELSSTLKEVGSNRLALSGSLTLSTMPALAREGQRLLKSMRTRGSDGEPVTIEIDLGEIERSSSAGIALLLDWVDQAGRDGISIAFRRWPESLARIAALSNVEGLLGIEAEQYG